MFTVEQIKSLNELEMQVYQYVMLHRASVPYMRIRELAAETFVSPSTIMRFCKKMGCDGYTEFRWKLKEEEGQNRDQVKQLPEDFRDIHLFFDELEGGKYEDKLEEAASMIAKSEHIVLVGIGNSGSIAQYGAYCLSNMGKFSMFVSDPFYPTHLLNSASRLAIVMSVSGETPEVIESIDRFRKAGFKIISITDHDTCTAAKMSDLNIAYNITMHRGPYPMDFSTQARPVYLLETIGSKVGNRLSED